jgi:iron complex transport system substrate-binding protein
MYKKMQTVKFYSFLIFFIITWWAFAFKKNGDYQNITKNCVSFSPTNRPLLDTAITLIDRGLLHQALAGDTQLMARLIADWDIDAQILHSKGFDGIKRIPYSDFLHSQSLIRILQNEDYVKKTAIFLKQQNQFIMDDLGKCIDLKPTYQRFLPQTFAAASILLSLLPTEQIIALPRHLRNQTSLYPKSLTNKIPLDIDRYNAEKLFQARPEVAFVAHYSHPATIQALSNQGVFLYTMKNILSFADISQELIHLGNIISKPLQAELMKIFIDAAICAIDNQQAVLIKNFQLTDNLMPKVLVVNFHQTFSVPTFNSLTGQILSRMPTLDISLKYTEESGQSKEWMASIDRERLIHLNPDFLIVTTTNPDAAAKNIKNDPALRELSAVRQNRLVFIDELIQQTPSQYVVLAYHDLIHALIQP